MIDTLKLSKGLQKAGMQSEQAEKIAEAINESQTDYVTKKDLDLGLEKVMNRVGVLMLGKTALILGGVYFLLNFHVK